MTKRIGLFFRGWLQVFLVSLQTMFLIAGNIPGIVIVGFLISFVWTLNVKSAAFGGCAERLVYSLGASSGAISGYYLAGAL